jgi:hypothetical protein
VKRLVWLVIVIVLAACTPENAPAPTESATHLYTYASGEFALNLPPSWAVGDLSAGPNLLVTFAPPGAERPLLTIYAVRAAAPLDDAAFRDAMEIYLAADYNARLEVRERGAMGDGSWRVTAIRTAQGAAVPVNVFMQRDGAVFSALEVAVPANDALTTAILTQIVNSYTVDVNADWQTGEVAGVPAVPPEVILAAGNLSFSGILVWTAPDGTLTITGRVANRAPYPLEAVTVQAALLNPAGLTLAEAGTTVPLPVVLNGEYAPFAVHFDGPRPAQAARISLQSGGRQAVAALAGYAGPENFEWEDRAEYDSGGQLHVLGTIWNAGQTSMTNVEALITLLDSADRVAGYVTIPVADRLEPGASIRFDAPVPPLGGDPASYLVAVQGRRG